MHSHTPWRLFIGYLSFYLFILLFFLFLASVIGFMVSAQLGGNRSIPSALWTHDCHGWSDQLCPKLTVLCPRNPSSPIRRKPQGERPLWVGDKTSPPPQYGSHCFGLREGLVPFMFLAQKLLFQSHRIPFDKRESLIWKGLAKTKWRLKGQDPGNLLHLPRSSPWGLP